MLRKKIQILNELALHARAAAKLVKALSPFSSKIEIHFNNKSANAKDMLELMLLDIAQYNWVDIVISGGDESEYLSAWTSIETLINNFFGEGK